MRLTSLLLAALTLASSTWGAAAADHYVAPLGKALTCTATGTQACPWPTVAAAFASKKIVGGDTILLMDGDHGSWDINYQMFDTPVTIQSQTANNAHIQAITFGASTKGITVRSVKIWRLEGDIGTTFLVRSYSGSTNITLENIDFRSRENSIDYLSWSKERWIAAATDAIVMNGSASTIRNNTLTGVKQGIVAGANSLVEGNIVDGFASDGMKGVGGSTFRNNIVKNCFGVFEGYHRDGFQSYTPGPPIVGLVVDGNTFIQWALPRGNPLMGSLQGIGLFDGFYDNLVIRNNLVVTLHSHGISVYGTRGATIANNTVVNLDGVPATAPWILISAHTDGTPSQDVVVSNNLAMQFVGTPSPENNVVFVNNSLVLNPALAFEDITKFNYRPKAASGFIDSGNTTYAPLLDILGAARPAGAGPDRGAYEIGATGGTTDGSGTGGTTTGDGSTTGGTTGDGSTSGDGSTTGGGTTTSPSSGAKFVKAVKKKVFGTATATP
jgi:hypothetical protein